MTNIVQMIRDREAELEVNEERNERAKRVCERYDELRKIGAHGHYETMMRVVREEVEREREDCARLADMEAALCRARATTFDKLTAHDRRLEDVSLSEAYEDFAITAESIAKAIRFRSQL